MTLIELARRLDRLIAQEVPEDCEVLFMNEDANLEHVEVVEVDNRPGETRIVLS